MQVNKLRSSCYAAAVGVLLSIGGTPAFAQSDNQAWVSDELSTYVRSGPTDGYRIVGTLKAGEQVEVLETSGDYTRVRSNSGDTVWVLSSELQQDPSARQQLPILQAQVDELTQELDGINDTWEQRISSMTETLDIREKRIVELEARNHDLDSEAEQSRQQVRALQARLETQEEDLLMRYFMYGGGVAGAGLLVGLIVPHLPRRRKKRDRWF
ncbi:MULTISPECIES: TIGR04211 family SH3 domain-containing protein [Halomonadaceae]|jgi:SH3 domain protein|uniref:Peptide-binding protein n=1 Tax=Vreelandella venusta TaxID=44935 RepID=A0AAP9ZGE9_9GAMM|nr:MULTISPECIES: TIGR04211 family SH3 domain-containing protein [Halomonas]MBR9926350.1 SH3 domain-containing protein [Gammaproteobacteria bacterium]AZM95331.1 SH3 domain-containing protein [Halomonas venusta]MDW0360596.1 TIGR04211 family SH3 domain-containing protein [Halomonas venusta]MDX1353900.1 TIGR04211 family SH3 domain-containing protein [Halomonas venusta]MDX1714250.1 TIGR04211 family SH3 domain-containing protein [Halomonas venusta]